MNDYFMPSMKFPYMTSEVSWIPFNIFLRLFEIFMGGSSKEKLKIFLSNMNLFFLHMNGESSELFSFFSKK
jgi:hypothetical protein